MPSVFTRIISGEFPARWIWRDEQVVAFLTIEPVAYGHTLVIPRAEIESWLDLDDATAARLHTVAQAIGKAIAAPVKPRRVGYTLVGLEVPHTHIHLIPLNTGSDLNFANAMKSPDATKMDTVAAAIRRELRAAGAAGVVDA
jgi:histidine triad (HIT) family protein